MSTNACSTTSRSESTTRESHAPATSLQNVGQRERWVSTALGGGLVLMGVARGRLSGLLMALGGGALLYRGLTGSCSVYRALDINTAEPGHRGVPAQEGEKVEKTLLIQRSPEDLFRFWRHLENLPKIMDNLIAVEPREGNRSHWVARGPMNTSVEWDAEIFQERENEMLAWRSLPGSQIDTAGSVHFDPASAGRGTRVRVSLKFNPPAGRAGAKLAALLGADVDAQIERDLRRFKELMEAGEVPTTHGQPAGPRS